MSTALLILAFLSILNFVYGAILVPSLRLRLRYRLFALRDDLRTWAIEQPKGSDIDSFKYLQSGINNGLSILSILDASVLAEADEAVKKDENLRRRAEKRREVLDSCDNKEFQRIRNELSKTVMHAFMVNSGTWFFYLVPIVFVIVCIGRISKAVASLFYIPEGEFSKAIPSLPATA